MDEQALRAIVREAIARHLGTGGRALEPPPPPLVPAGHASHYRYLLPESDGPCIIEPSVRCNHCGYCQSHGH
jgi:hypothetical protein